MTYTGVPLVLPPESLETWIDNNISIHDARMLVGPANHPGRNGGLTFLRAQENNRLKLYQLYYPNTASKWAEFWFLATRSQLNDIEVKTYSTGEATTGSLSLNTGHGIVSTNMHMLPPRALAELGRTNQGRDLYLCCLVDDRYFWQGYKSTGKAELTSWDTLFSTIADNMDITLLVDTIDPSYGTPSEYSELYNATQYANAAAFLDAACMNVGHRLIRTLDGLYQTKTYANCHDIYTANKQVLSYKTAGGETISTHYAQDAYRQCVIIPEKFVVTYPVYCHDTQSYELPRTQQQQQPWSTGNIWTTTVNTSDLNPSGSSASFGYIPGTTKVVHDTARAYYCECANKSYVDQPQNETGLKELASKIAKDYIDWKRYCTTPDYVLNGIQSWTPDGICDITWEYSNHTCFTRVQGDPYNLDFEDLHHEITASCSGSSTSTSDSPSSSSSPSSSTPPSQSSPSQSSPSQSPSQSSPSQESPDQRCSGTETVVVGKGQLYREGDYVCQDTISLVFVDGYFCYSAANQPSCVYICCSSNPSSSGSSQSYSQSSYSSPSSSSCGSDCNNTRCVWTWATLFSDQWEQQFELSECTSPCYCPSPPGPGTVQGESYIACCELSPSSSISESSGSSGSSTSGSSTSGSASSSSSATGCTGTCHWIYTVAAMWELSSSNCNPAGEPCTCMPYDNPTPGTVEQTWTNYCGGWQSAASSSIPSSSTNPPTSSSGGSSPLPASSTAPPPTSSGGPPP